MLIDTTATTPSGVVTSFMTTMVGLSVATERVTQIIKQWLSKGTTPPPVGLTQFISFGIGFLVVAFSGQDPLGIHGFASGLDGFRHWQNWLDWLLFGASGVRRFGLLESCSGHCPGRESTEGASG